MKNIKKEIKKDAVKFLESKDGKEYLKLNEDNMKTPVNKTDFINAFKKLRSNNFSYEGLDALYDHIYNLEEDTDGEIDLDVIAFCCDYSEYENLEEYKKSYSSINSIKDIKFATTYIPIPNTQRFITQNH